MILSPDPLRPTDEWRVDPTSDKLRLNEHPLADHNELFAQLLQAKKAGVEAIYDGVIDGVGTPLDKLTVADFTVRPNSPVTPPPRRGAEGKQKTFGLSSFKCIIGRPHLGLFPSRGQAVTIDLASCAVVADGDPLQDAGGLIDFLLTRSNINVTPYLVGGALVQVEMETDA
ncbi:hypothetical protein C1280_06620 [Gemmata obscuriglobus]|uniref:Uncharacterized protein n=2 Tax=Gemmata obscuriglobus TaxID=114 RepID=A0A2Z3H0T0_9BACT|nr:hypothetical protein C1280_06620 [Gemmata obscuriglobus]